MGEFQRLNSVIDWCGEAYGALTQRTAYSRRSSYLTEIEMRWGKSKIAGLQEGALLLFLFCYNQSDRLQCGEEAEQTF
jgi:hypothetical protein